MRAPANFIALPFLCVALLLGCSASGVSTEPAGLGQPATLVGMEATIGKPGPITLEKHLAANWSVPLSGLLNLNHPKALAAGLEDRQEPIHIYVYTLRHPKFGTFIVDSGISESFINASDNEDVSFIVSKAMNMSQLEVKLTTAELNRRVAGIDGVFLTHIHMDHIMGLTDLAPGVPVYIGPGDAAAESALHMATRGTTDRLLANVGVLQEWQFGPDGVIDIFGDGSVWAIHVPGHTPGATAYLVRTTTGSELLIGDATHTSWGWENGVEPGTYSQDGPLSAISLALLKRIAGENPQMRVHPGHQSLGGSKGVGG